MRFTLKHIEYFVAAARSASLTEAAQRAGISPASVSMAISHLEEEFAVKLFNRHFSRGMELTPAGRLFLERAMGLLEMAGGFYQDASDLTSKVRGEITVGCLVTLAPILVPPLARTVARRYPEVLLHHAEGSQDTLVARLRREEIDLALTYDMHLSEDIAFEECLRLAPKVVMDPDHPLALRPRLTVAEIAEEPYILLDLPQSRDWFLGIFARAGFMPNTVMSSSSPEVVRALAANGLGITIMAVTPQGTTADGRPTVHVPLDCEGGEIALGLVRKASRATNALQTAIMDLARELLASRSIAGLRDSAVPPEGRSRLQES